MPDTRITKERLKNHWMYSSWKYLVLFIIFIAGWNLTYSITQYKPPREKRLEMYILSTSYDTEKTDALADELAEIFVGEGEDDMEEVNIYTLNYGGDDDTYGPQVLMTRLAAQEGDVYMVDEETMTSFVSQMLALPLDEYIESGALNVDGIDLETGMRTEVVGEDEDNNVVYGEDRKVYAIPAEQLYGMLDDSMVDNRGMYLVVMAYTDKPDTCIELLNELISRYKEDKPEWLIQQEEQTRQEIADLPTEMTVDSLSAQATEEPADEGTDKTQTDADTTADADNTDQTDTTADTSTDTTAGN